MTADPPIRDDAGVDVPLRHRRTSPPAPGPRWTEPLRPHPDSLVRGPSDGGAGADWRSDRADFWARSLRGWDVAFYAMWALGVASYFFERPSRGLGLAVALTMFALLMAAYLLIGRRAAIAGNRHLAVVYLLIMFACVTAVVSATQTGTLLLFIAYSQVWYFAATRRMGVTLTVVLTVCVFSTIGLQSDVDSLADAGPFVTQAAIAIAFSVLLGLWVTQVAEQSEDRAELLAQLEAAQAEAAASHHAAGVMAERERMSREIHDTLAQGFTSVIMLAQTAAADLRRDRPEQAGERLDLIERTARDNLAEARALVAAGAPVGLAESTLTEALERLAVRFGQETGVRVRVVADDAALAGLARDREVVLLRAAQEALSNVRRHARARNVDLVLTGDPAGRPGDPAASAARGVVRLEVVDDGQGMDPTAVEGYGLRGMRDRVTSEGGDLAVTSDVGRGTRVRVTVPSVADGAPGAPAADQPEDDGAAARPADDGPTKEAR